MYTRSHQCIQDLNNVYTRSSRKVNLSWPFPPRMCTRWWWTCGSMQDDDEHLGACKMTSGSMQDDIWEYTRSHKIKGQLSSHLTNEHARWHLGVCKMMMWEYTRWWWTSGSILLDTYWQILLDTYWQILLHTCWQDFLLDTCSQFCC